MNMTETGFQPTFLDREDHQGLFWGGSKTNNDQFILDVSIMNKKNLNQKETMIASKTFYNEILKKVEMRFGEKSGILDKMKTNNAFEEWLKKQMSTEEGITQKKIDSIVRDFETNNYIFTKDWSKVKVGEEDQLSNTIWSGVDETMKKRKRRIYGNTKYRNRGEF